MSHDMIVLLGERFEQYALSSLCPNQIWAIKVMDWGIFRLFWPVLGIPPSPNRSKESDKTIKWINQLDLPPSLATALSLSLSPSRRPSVNHTSVRLGGAAAAAREASFLQRQEKYISFHEATKVLLILRGTRISASSIGCWEVWRPSFSPLRTVCTFRFSRQSGVNAETQYPPRSSVDVPSLPA